MPGIKVGLFLLFVFPCTSMAGGEPLLVDTNWLFSQLGQKDIALIDMSDSMQFSRFHIPGARHLPYDAINHYSRQQLSLSIGSMNIARVLGQLGISPEMHIVIYDDVGGLNASRLFWELERLGHTKLSLLDGGLVKWILEGKKVVATDTSYPKTYYPYTASDTDNKLANLADLTPAGKVPPVLLDVRSQDEFQGHPQQKLSGHIRGAKWWQWEDNVDFENAFRFKPEKSLSQHAQGLGLTDKNREIIVYCRSGHRAAHSYFTLRKLGFSHVRLYDGSMAEFSLLNPSGIQKGMTP